MIYKLFFPEIELSCVSCLILVYQLIAYRQLINNVNRPSSFILFCPISCQIERMSMIMIYCMNYNGRLLLKLNAVTPTQILSTGYNPQTTITKS